MAKNGLWGYYKSNKILDLLAFYIKYAKRNDENP